MERRSLRKKDLSENPINEMEKWLSYAYRRKIKLANLMCLITVKKGKPSSRMVFLKRILDDGFIFFSNKNSRKGKAIEENPNGAVNFFWRELNRQICIEGKIKRVERSVEEEQFKFLPKNLKIKYYILDKGDEVESRDALKDIYNEHHNAFQWEDVPIPVNWSGYYFEPNYFEFVQGEILNIPDRLVYKKENGKWIIERRVL